MRDFMRSIMLVLVMASWFYGVKSACDIESIQAEVDRITRLFTWKSDLPTFKIIYNKLFRDSAALEIHNKTILIGYFFKNLPHHCQRFILAHEIAHYCQKQAGYISFFPSCNANFTFTSALPLLACAWACGVPTSKVHTAYGHKIYFDNFPLFPTHSLYMRYQRLEEIDADTRASIILQDALCGIDTFKIIDLMEHIIQKTLIYLCNHRKGLGYKILKSLNTIKDAFHRTHPTDKQRIRYLSVLQKKCHFSSEPVLSDLDIKTQAILLAKRYFIKAKIFHKNDHAYVNNLLAEIADYYR